MKLFNWFNPLWLVQNFFTTSINPITIGAGIGALGSAVTGKSPFTGALLGGTLGGLGNAAGLFGQAGAAAGAGGYVAPSATSGIVGTTGEIGSSLLSPTLASEGVMGLGSNAALNTAANAASIAPNFNIPSTSLFDNIGLGNLSTMDKVNLGIKGLDIANQPQQQMQTPPLMPIRPGNPELVSTPLMNVAPNVGLQQGNKIGIPNLATKMPLSEADILRLQQLAQQGIRG